MHAFLFPGQGSQKVGMGKSLAEAFAPAREVFAEVDDAVSQKLSALMWEGPAEDLTLTANAQPAIMAVSMAIIRVLEDAGLDMAKHARCVAGHSLGEYSALAAAGSFSLADTARLLKIRGTAMQQAVPVGKGGMCALIGVDLDFAESVCAEAMAEGVEASPLCVVANDNAPGQVVISGTMATVKRAGDIAKDKGAKRALMLAVSAPFHSPLMAPAAEKMAQALSEVTIHAPKAALVANVTAAATTDPDTIRTQLIEQVTGRVRWRESVAGLAALDVDSIVECGGNKVLSGMVKRIDKNLTCINLDEPADIDAFARTL